MADSDEFIPDPDFVPDRPKHAPPREHSDAELGIESGPQARSGLKIGPVMGLIPEEADAFAALGPTEQAEFKRRRDEAGRAFLAEIGGQVVGSAAVPVGEGVGAPIGRKIVSKAAGAGKIFANVAPRTTEAVSKALAHSEKELGKLYMAKAVAQDIGAAAGKSATVVAPVAEAAVREGIPAAVAPNVSGPMSNAIDRLRASAVGNPRAADLLARITQLQQPSFPAPLAPDGTVTQGTLGEPNAH